MSENNEITPFEHNILINIFLTEEDKNGTDLLEMSDFFKLFIDDSYEKLHSFYQWENTIDFGALFGRLAVAMKAGLDINDMGIMVADSSHFSQEIIDGLKKGIYHIGHSKEVAGNLRPAILDKDKHIVKWFTMKKAIDPKEMLSDVSSLSMQNSLRQISSELKGISQDLKYEIEFNRRQSLSLPFINARTRFLSAINNPKDKNKFLDQAESYLIEGLNALYLDIDAEVKRLGESDLKPNQNKIKEFFVGNLKYADDIIGHINEDLLMIPKYVAVEVYILHHLKRYEDAKDVIEKYRYHLDKMTNIALPDSEYTATQVIHDLYPYKKENVDFWLDMPQQTISGLDSLQLLIEPKQKDIFLIESTTEGITESDTEDDAEMIVEETEAENEQDNKDNLKRCRFCHKRILNNKDGMCKRCWLKVKDMGEKVVGGVAALGAAALVVVKAAGDINNKSGDD